MNETTESPTGPGHSGPPGSPPIDPGARWSMPALPTLRRSRDDRVIGGVCGGVSRAFGIDPIILRVLLVVLALAGGAGLLAYLVAWALLPEEPPRGAPAPVPDEADRRRTLLVAIVIGIALLVGFSLSPLGFGWWGGPPVGGVVVIAVIIAAVVLIAQSRNDTTRGNPTGTGPAGNDPRMAAMSTDTTQIPVTPTGYAYGGDGGWGEPHTPAPDPDTTPPRDPWSPLGLITLSLAAIAAGVFGLLAINEVGSIGVTYVLAVPLGILAVGLLVGAFVGRARWLMSIAIPLAVVAQISTVAPDGNWLRGGIGDREFAPTTIAQASAGFELGLGESTLDLTAVPADPTGAPIEVDARVGVGQLTVLVPWESTVLLDATVGFGGLIVGDQPEQNGSDLSLATELPAASSPTGPTFVLDAEVGVGQLVIRRAARSTDPSPTPTPPTPTPTPTPTASDAPTSPATPTPGPRTGQP